VPWLVSFWCLAHQLELAVKDVLTSSNLYTMIDEMLMHAYYLYEKSPKKCHELDEVVTSLRQCLEEDDMPATKTRGNRPLRACETRFLSHKVTDLLSVMVHTLITLLHLQKISPWNLLINRSSKVMFANGEIERYSWIVQWFMIY